MGVSLHVIRCSVSFKTRAWGVVGGPGFCEVNSFSRREPHGRLYGPRTARHGPIAIRGRWYRRAPAASARRHADNRCRVRRCAGVPGEQPCPRTRGRPANSRTRAHAGPGGGGACGRVQARTGALAPVNAPPRPRRAHRGACGRRSHDGAGLRDPGTSVMSPHRRQRARGAVVPRQLSMREARVQSPACPCVAGRLRSSWGGHRGTDGKQAAHRNDTCAPVGEGNLHDV